MKHNHYCLSLQLIHQSVPPSLSFSSSISLFFIFSFLSPSAPPTFASRFFCFLTLPLTYCVCCNTQKLPESDEMVKMESRTGNSMTKESGSREKRDRYRMRGKWAEFWTVAVMWGVIFNGSNLGPRRGEQDNDSRKREAAAAQPRQSEKGVTYVLNFHNNLEIDCLKAQKTTEIKCVSEQCENGQISVKV